MIEDYKDAEDNYIGYISHTDLSAVCTKFYEETFPTYTASKVVGEETYYRCGAMKAKLGTRVGLEEFQSYYTKFGGRMLTEAQLRALLPVEEVE
jgi:hypothetical protein